MTNTKLESGVFFTQTLAFRYRLFELSLQNLVVAHESTPKKETTKADCQLSTLLLQPLSSDQTRPSGIIEPIMVALEEMISLNTPMAGADRNNQLMTTLWHNPDRNGHF